MGSSVIITPTDAARFPCIGPDSCGTTTSTGRVCCASGCIAWCWVDPMPPPDPDFVKAGFDAQSFYAHLAELERKNRRGYCGLAGVPKDVEK